MTVDPGNGQHYDSHPRNDRRMDKQARKVYCWLQHGIKTRPIVGVGVFLAAFIGCMITRPDRAELWRAAYNSSGCSDTAKTGCSSTTVAKRTVSGTSNTGTLSDAPSAGTFWCDLHTSDASGNVRNASSPVKVICTSGSPAQTANPNANAKTVATLNYLKSLPSKTENKILSGQYVGPMHSINTTIFPNIYSQSGQYPAIMGAEYFPVYHEDLRNDFTEVNNILIDHSRKGGLVTIMAHSPNPHTGHFFVNGVPPDKDTTFVYFVDLVTEGTAVNTAWKADLDRMAAGLAALQAANVAVLFRPFHEMNGWWFWWGGKPADQFKAAWIYMFNYYTYTMKLNNLLWVYGPDYTTTGSVLDKYPGSQYVDVVGVDKYDGLSGGVPNYGELISTGKPAGLAEFGTCYSDGSDCTPPKDMLPMLNSIKSGSPNTVFWLNYSGPWSMDLHLNVNTLLNDPWVINRGEITLPLNSPLRYQYYKKLGSDKLRE
jgi:mannan endo-1,4-beta-mannosidase